MGEMPHRKGIFECNRSGFKFSLVKICSAANSTTGNMAFLLAERAWTNIGGASEP